MSPGDKQQNYLEMDRRGSSCPTLFAWNGESYELVGDMLGAGVVGHWVGPGQRDIPRPVEYIKIKRDAIREKNGRLSFRFMEPLEEAVYLDQARLLAVDHPADLDVYPERIFCIEPAVSAVQSCRQPRCASTGRARGMSTGTTCCRILLAHRYFGDFALTQFQGFAKPHSLDLDLGEPYRRRAAVAAAARRSRILFCEQHVCRFAGRRESDLSVCGSAGWK